MQAILVQWRTSHVNEQRRQPLWMVGVAMCNRRVSRCAEGRYNGCFITKLRGPDRDDMCVFRGGWRNRRNSCASSMHGVPTAVRGANKDARFDHD